MAGINVHGVRGLCGSWIWIPRQFVTFLQVKVGRPDSPIPAAASDVALVMSGSTSHPHVRTTAYVASCTLTASRAKPTGRGSNSNFLAMAAAGAGPERQAAGMQPPYTFTGP